MRVSLAIFLIAGLLAGQALAVDLRLMSGDEQGTYYQIGQEISRETNKVGLNLQVLPSAGSWSNIIALFNNDTEFAIFQMDAYIKAGRNLYQNTSLDIRDEIKVVMPLFHEEIHLIKTKNSNLDFATNKTFTVGCGQENSGSCLSADVIAQFYDKQFTYVHNSYEQALADLKAGELDLVVITAGKPFKLLSEQTGLDLISLPRTRKAAEFYLYTTISQEDYPWLDRPVETYGVRSVLATMIQEQEGLASDLVGTVHFTILINEDRLKQQGHPKWNEVFFRAYNEKTTHSAVLNSLGAYNVIRSYGYNARSLAIED
ncbi:MAG: TAXI family TRAP transporter solute-binding subunit [Desulfuromonadales bacterium]